MFNQTTKLSCKPIISIIFLLVIMQQSSTFAKTKLHDNKLSFARQEFKISKEGRTALDSTGSALFTTGPIGGAFGAIELAVAEGVGIKYVKDIGVTFIESDHCVHSDQPYKGVVSNNSNELSVLAGRKDSKYVAECFNNWLKGGGASTFDHSPSALNFAVKGTLQVTVPVKKDKQTTYQVFTFKDMILAEGRKGSTNNWWIAGVNCKHKNHGRIACSPEGYSEDSRAVCFNRPFDQVSTIHLVSCQRTY